MSDRTEIFMLVSFGRVRTAEAIWSFRTVHTANASFTPAVRTLRLGDVVDRVCLQQAAAVTHVEHELATRDALAKCLT